MNKQPIIKKVTALTAAFLAATTLAGCGDKKPVPSDREVKALFITGLDGNAMPMGRKAGHTETPGEVTWVPKSEKVNVGGKSVTHHWSEAVYPTSVAITPESRDCPAFVGFTKEPGVFTDGSTTVLKRAACTPAEIEVEGNSTVHQRALFSVLGDVLSVGVGVNFEITNRDPDQTNINNQHSTSASSNQSSNNDLSAVAQQQQGQHQDQQQAQQQKQGQKQTSNNNNWNENNNNNWNENNNNNWNENNNNNWNKNYNQQKTEYRGGKDGHHGGCGRDKHGRETCAIKRTTLTLG